MALATGTAMLIGTGLTAAGAFGKAKLEAGAAKRASTAQEKAAQEAMAYQRERQAAADMWRQRIWDDYQTKHAAWTQRNFGDKGGAPSAGPATIQQAPVVMPSRSIAAAGLAGLSPAMSEAPQDELGGDLMQRPRTLGEVSDWHNWSRYGV